MSPAFGLSGRDELASGSLSGCSDPMELGWFSSGRLDWASVAGFVIISGMLSGSSAFSGWCAHGFLDLVLVLKDSCPLDWCGS